MPRSARRSLGGVVFHVVNRGVGRRRLFHRDEDYAGFERTMELALAAVPVRLLAYCLMRSSRAGTCPTLSKRCSRQSGRGKNIGLLTEALPADTS